MLKIWLWQRGLKTRYLSRLDSSSRNRNSNNCWKFDELFHFQKESLTEILPSPGKNVKFYYKNFENENRVSDSSETPIVDLSENS